MKPAPASPAPGIAAAKVAVTGAATGAASGALAALLQQMQRRSDFPAASAAIVAINRVASSEDGDATTLASAILKDYALTKRILRLVNSVPYGQFAGQRVSTISRAIVILGVDTIRSMTVSLLLFDQIRDRARAESLAIEFLRASLAALIARALCPIAIRGNAEEAYLCGLFHSLGRIIACCYFHDEAQSIRHLREREHLDEDQAAARVLGVSYEALGMAVAQGWGFPDSIVHSLQRFVPGRDPSPGHPLDGLRALSSFSATVAELIESTLPAERGAAIERLCRRYRDYLTLTPKQVDGATEAAIDGLFDLAAIFNLDIARSPLGEPLRQARRPAAVPPASPPFAVPTEPEPDATLVHDEPLRAEPINDCDALLTAGIQELSNALLDDGPLADILRIGAETVFRALAVRRVILCLRDGRTQRMVGRLAFGDDPAQPPGRFQFPLPAENAADAPLFNLILAQDIDVLVANAADAKIRERLPDWYRAHFDAPSFLVMPMRLRQSSVAMLYADVAAAGALQIAPKTFALLRTLRNQLVLAIKQQR